jgi:hypothetical protein
MPIQIVDILEQKGFSIILGESNIYQEEFKYYQKQDNDYGYNIIAQKK